MSMGIPTDSWKTLSTNNTKVLLFSVYVVKNIVFDLSLKIVV
jgi:hypothetical protein